MRFVKVMALLLISTTALAAVEFGGTYVRYYGTGTNDDDVLFTTGDLTQYDACAIMSTTGAVDVFASLDGVNYATAALSLEDKGATSSDPVVVTAAARIYGFVLKAKGIRVLQNGGTAAAASMICWKL